MANDEAHTNGGGRYCVRRPIDDLGSGRRSSSMIAQFATDKPVTLKGTVTGMLWRNPHGAIFLDVVGAEGQIERWRVETGSTPRMMRRGLSKSDIRPGREVIIGGYAARDGQSKLAGLVITFLDREAAGEEATFALGR